MQTQACKRQENIHRHSFVKNRDHCTRHQVAEASSHMLIMEVLDFNEAIFDTNRTYNDCCTPLGEMRQQCMGPGLVSCWPKSEFNWNVAK